MNITSMQNVNPTAGGVAYTLRLSLHGIDMMLCRKECDVLTQTIDPPLLSLLLPDPLFPDSELAYRMTVK
jgi:hypothetical protein